MMNQILNNGGQPFTQNKRQLNILNDIDQEV